MTKAKIFLVGESEDDLVPMEESSYVAEAHLQELLVRYPDLLPGDQITPDDPRRWLLVAREMAVPGDERWPPWYGSNFTLSPDRMRCSRSGPRRPE